MLQRYYSPWEIATPAGTAIASPKVTNVTLPPAHIYTVQVRIPPGHAGFTGIAMIVAGAVVIPWTQTLDYIVGNDDDLYFDIGMDTGGAFVLQTYNTDVLDHTHYVRIAYQPLPVAPQPTTVAVLPIVQ